MYNDDLSAIPPKKAVPEAMKKPVSLPMRPIPLLPGRVIFWFSLASLLHFLLRMIGKAPLPMWVPIVSGIGLLIGVLLTKAFNGTIIFNPRTRKVVFETTILGKQSSSIIHDFSQIHAIGVDSQTVFMNSSSGLRQTYDNSMISSSSYRVIAVSSSGKIISLSDFIKDGEGQMNDLASKVGNLLGCAVIEGEPSTKIKAIRLANGRYSLQAEIYDSVEKQNKVLFTLMFVCVVAFLIAVALEK